jgi:hypothetical protein
MGKIFEEEVKIKKTKQSKQTYRERMFRARRKRSNKIIVKVEELFNIIRTDRKKIT